MTSTPDVQSDLAVAGFQILGPVGAPAIPELIRMVNATNADYLAARSLYALANIGKPVLPELAKLLADTNQLHRMQAIEIAGHLSDMGIDVSSLEPVLLPYLNDPHPSIRQAATNAFLYFAPDRVIPNLPQ